VKPFNFRIFVLTLFVISFGYQIYWIDALNIGSVPGPVDPFLKTLQGYSLKVSNFTDQSLYYRFRNIDKNYEFCLFQKNIFTFRLGDSLLGPFPITLTSIIAFLLNFFSFNKVFLFFSFLNFFLYVLIYKSVKKNFAILFLILFGLPFFIPNSEVSEHALLIIFQIIGYYFFRKFRYSNFDLRNKKFIHLSLSGFFFGIGLFLRHEVLIFGNFLILTLIFLKYIRRKENFLSLKLLISFALSMYVAFILFFVMNKFMYGSSVGPRLNANSAGLYSDLGNKLSFYKVILWKEGPYFGLFGKNPIFLVTCFLILFFRKKWTSLDWMMIFPSIGLILIVPLLAPNDGGSPWGARYLFLCIFPLVFLTGRMIKWSESLFSGKFSLGIQIFILLFTIHALGNERKGLLASKKVSEQQSKYMTETSVGKADIIVFTSELIAMQTGENYINYPVILLNHEGNFINFKNKFLKDKEKFKTIVLIEPKTENMNLSKFSAEDLEGIKPDGIIKKFNLELKLTQVENKELVNLYWYKNL